MNGEDKTYFEALLTEKFTNLHGRIDDLKKSIDIIHNLPCEVHKEQIKGNKNKIALVWGVMVVMIGALAKTAIGW